MLGSKGKGKKKESAAAEEEDAEEVEEFTLLTKWTPELLAQLLPKPIDVVENEGLEGVDVVFLCKVGHNFYDGQTIVSNNLMKRSPSADDVLKDPLGDGLSIFLLKHAKFWPVD
ncbi:hypothetical protein C0995_003609 [Termitomyces sp. Mi166|nr:hypothetical protein C0995_003609 [Termitomyces sp. Mi166\